MHARINSQLQVHSCLIKDTALCSHTFAPTKKTCPCLLHIVISLTHTVAIDTNAACVWVFYWTHTSTPLSTYINAIAIQLQLQLKLIKLYSRCCVNVFVPCGRLSLNESIRAERKFKKHKAEILWNCVYLSCVYVCGSNTIVYVSVWCVWKIKATEAEPRSTQSTARSQSRSAGRYWRWLSMGPTWQRVVINFKHICIFYIQMCECRQCEIVELVLRFALGLVSSARRKINSNRRRHICCCLFLCSPITTLIYISSYPHTTKIHI